jgi:1,2-dihydroxy-3-keto-5-methylthiopentene dioxygenase
MRAYPLDDPKQAIGAGELAEQGVLSWIVPEDEAARATFIDGIKREHHYVDEDVVALSPELPNLDEICAKFDKEHFHTEDEVRLVLEGEGIFDVRDANDRWVRIEVAKGDMIVIPARAHHRFYLGSSRHIRCVRLFANHDGWAPVYRGTA